MSDNQQDTVSLFQNVVSDMPPSIWFMLLLIVLLSVAGILIKILGKEKEPQNDNEVPFTVFLSWLRVEIDSIKDRNSGNKEVSDALDEIKKKIESEEHKDYYEDLSSEAW